MGRHKKNGYRATGIQSKSGMLYIVTSTVEVDEDGTRHTKKVWRATALPDNPENVKRACQLRQALFEKDTVVIDRNISVVDYTNYFLGLKAREVANTTYAAYIGRANHVKEYFGRKKVSDVSKRDIEAFLDSVFENHMVQPRTVKDIKSFLSMMLEKAVMEGIIAINPCKAVTLNKQLAARHYKQRNLDESFFSYEEAVRFLEITKDHELHALFYFTLVFGLRREEVLGLKWDSIDWAQNCLHIQHTVTKGTAVNRLNTTKTDASLRTYPLEESQIAFLKNLKQKEDDWRSLFGNGYKDNDYIFKHADGTLYYPDYPTKAFKKIIMANPELPQDIHFHGLRTSCVSILVHNGFDVKSIQKWVGHADINTTLKIYTKVKDQEAKGSISTSISNMFPV